MQHNLFEITAECRDGYLFVTAVGPVTEKSLVDLGHTLRQACEKANLRGAVIDCQAMEGALSPGELFYATQKFVKTVGTDIHVAYINPPPHWVPEHDQFSRNVANNRGGSLELFATEADAAKWIARQMTTPSCQ